VKEGLFEVINSSASDGQWSEEYQLRRPDGKYVTVLDRGFVLRDENAQPYRMIGCMLDVSELRRIEREVVENIEQREFMADTVPLMLWTAIAVGRMTFFNQNFYSYTGLTPTQSLGAGWQSAVEPEDLANLEKAWQDASEKRSDFSVEVRLRSHDDTFFWHLLHARPKISQDGRILLWVGTNTNIHEQKLIAEIMEQKVAERTAELHRTNRELQNSNHDLQQFASVASHDLKEPLRKIQMFSNLLKDRYLKDSDETVIHYVDRIIHSSARMTRLINDLLNFSKLSADEHYTKINLNELLEEVLTDLELTIAEKKAHIEKNALPEIEGIPGQLRQVFQNIISNALKFSKLDKQPKVTIRTDSINELSRDAETVKKGRYLRIRISDDGIGFDNQYTDKIFTLFQRLHGRQEYEGTGIGLAICKKIVDKHNGLIYAQSADGHGATFTIILPYKQKQ